MRLTRYMLLLLVASLFTGFAAHADDCCDDYDFRCDRDDESLYIQELNEKDWEELYDYINTKRTINVNEKACNLTISGDVRVDWKNRCEKRHNEYLRGRPYKNLPFGRNDFDARFNLRLDYVCDRAWAVSHFQFDNSAGVTTRHSCEYSPEALHGSGSGCDIDLKKAYLGYNIWCDGCHRFDVEIGRRRLYQVFDSQVQFLSQFDGILFKYYSNWENVADWYIYLAGFVVDSRVNHYSWVTEFGLENIMDSCVDFKYSFIDWRKRGKNRCDVRDPVGARFAVSQFTLNYNFEIPYICMPTTAYGAFLWNADAEKGHPYLEDLDLPHKRANIAWYAGFRAGEVIKAGDYAFSVQYQYVQAKAIPDDDVSGIGRGNYRKESFWADGRGNTNFKGWRLEALYAFTDNISLDARVEWSHQIDKAFGGNQSYSQFRLEAIYAF